MATLDVSSIIQSARVVEDLNGLRFIETYLVKNVSGRTAQLDAMGATGIPAYGSPLSGYNNMFVIGRAPRPFENSTNQVLIDITYGPPSFADLNEPIISFHATTRDVETSLDREHRPIKVLYVSTGGALPIEIGRVNARKAEGVLTMDFQCLVNPEIFTPYINTINSRAWFDGDAYTWLCVDVQINKIWSRPGYRITMSFLYDEETHLPVAFYRIFGNVIPADIDPVDVTAPAGNGWVIPDLYRQLDFNSLPLPTNFP